MKKVPYIMNTMNEIIQFSIPRSPIGDDGAMSTRYCLINRLRRALSLRDSSGALTAVRKCAEIILTSFVRTSDIGQGENGDFTRDAYAFMTFGQGTRKCPSEHYTRSVMKCMLMTLMTRSRFRLPGSIDWFERKGPDTIEIEVLMKAKTYAKILPI